MEPFACIGSKNALVVKLMSFCITLCEKWCSSRLGIQEVDSCGFYS